MNSYTEAESDMSLESRSFLHSVNDQVRKRKNQSSKDATKDSDQHSLIWVMFVSSTLQACDSCRKRTGRPVLEGQSNPSFVPSVMKTHIPWTDDPAQEEDLLQRYKERIEKLSQQDRVSKFCTDAGFLTTVEVGQYFMTKDTAELSQFTGSVVCREYTLPRDESLSEPKGWIRGNTKIGPVLEVTTCCVQGKYGVEFRIESMNKDHSHSWVGIFHGLN